MSSDFFKNLNFRKWKCGQQPVVEPNNGSVCAVAIMADSKHQDIIVKFVFGIWKLPSLTILSFNAYFNQQSIYHSNILIKCLIDFFSPLLSHTHTHTLTWESLISFCKMLDLCYLHLTKWTLLRFEKKKNNNNNSGCLDMSQTVGLFPTWLAFSMAGILASMAKIWAQARAQTTGILVWDWHQP